MIRQLVFCTSTLLFSIFSFGAFALDFHTPQMTDEIRTLVLDRLETDETAVFEQGIHSAVLGLVGPAAFSCWCGKEMVGSNRLAQVLGSVFMTIISMPLTVPLGIAGTAGGFGFGCMKGISKEIGAKIYDSNFDKAITLHILQWITLVKNGRLAIRNDLKSHMESHGESSLKQAAISYLSNDKFSLYTKDLEEILSNMSQENDSWDKFFSALSKEVKLKNISEEKWKYLETYLATQNLKFKDYKLEDKDIGEYLPWALYFFSIVDKRGSRILKSYIASI